MKTLTLGLMALLLATATSCGRSSPEVEVTAKPAAPVETTAMKPIAGEADRTFSLSVPFESVSLTQGGEAAVRIGINRGQNFAEEVALKLSGLPMGVTLDTKDPVITQGSTGVALLLKADADAALGDFTVKVTGHTASSAADFSEEIKINVAQK